ncbi:MAG: hypothetical protein ACREU3_10240 [Steroidobacteraceae bacterium]
MSDAERLQAVHELIARALHALEREWPSAAYDAIARASELLEEAP